METGRILQGRYEVLEYLGQGETGSVHLCKDLHLPGKQWAVKKMTSGPALGREVEIMLGLRHRNLPAVIDHFAENDENFLVLEFVEGENLTTTVAKEGPINEFEALRWAVQISRVLGYLHSLPKPVLFRDLRPERVIVTPDRHIKLVDFGLARYLEPGQRGTQSRGAVAFTPPEQHLEGGSEDPRSDLYSLGATLFFALTGKAPNPTGHNNLSRLAPQLSRGTVALVERCLEPKPEKRFPSADSVTLRLEELLAGARAQRRLPRRVPLLLGAILLVGLVLGAALWLNRQHKDSSSFASPGAADRDRAELLLARGEYEEAIAILNDLVTRDPLDGLAHILLQNGYARVAGQKYQKIPVVTTLTDRAGGGYELLYGYALAQAEINRRGGVRGLPVVLDVFNDQAQVDKAISYAQTILRDKAYPLCLGMYSSQHTLAVAQLFNNAQVPLLTPVSSDPRVFDAGPYVFSTADPDTRRVRALADHFRREGFEQVSVVFNEQDVVCRSMADEFVQQFELGGGKLDRELGYRDQDFAPCVAALVADPPKLLFVSDYRGGLVREIVRKVREEGLDPAIATEIAPFEPDAPEGVVITTQFKPVPGPFLEEYKRMFANRIPSIRAAQAYDALEMVARLLEEQGTDPKTLGQVMRTTVSEGVTGKFSPGQVLEARPIYVVEVVRGEWIYSDPVVPGPRVNQSGQRT